MKYCSTRHNPDDRLTVRPSACLSSLWASSRERMDKAVYNLMCWRIPSSFTSYLIRFNSQSNQFLNFGDISFCEKWTCCVYHYYLVKDLQWIVTVRSEIKITFSNAMGGGVNRWWHTFNVLCGVLCSLRWIEIKKRIRWGLTSMVIKIKSTVKPNELVQVINFVSFRSRFVRPLDTIRMVFTSIPGLCQLLIILEQVLWWWPPCRLAFFSFMISSLSASVM